MGRLRYIEPELWDNPDLRRLGFIARDVFVYLFARSADDEGRFRWEPFSILEGTFSRNDPVTEEQVGGALDSLVSVGMLLRYGDAGELGFVTGWFTHQSMHKNVRRQSGLPRPPVSVGSWADADRVRDAYGKATGATGHRCSYRESLRWFVERVNNHDGDSTEALRKLSVDSTDCFPEEGEGEVEVTTRTPYAPSPPAEDAVGEYLIDADGVPAAKLAKRRRRSSKAEGQDDSGKRREEDPDQKFIHKAFERLTSTDLPTGSLAQYGTVRDWVKKRGYPLAAKWVDQHEQLGKPMPVGVDAWSWFATNLAEAMRKPWVWDPTWKP